MTMTADNEGSPAARRHMQAWDAVETAGRSMDTEAMLDAVRKEMASAREFIMAEFRRKQDRPGRANEVTYSQGVHDAITFCFKEVMNEIYFVRMHTLGRALAHEDGLADLTKRIEALEAGSKPRARVAAPSREIAA